MKKERNETIKKLVTNKFNIDNFKEFTARVINTKARDRKVSESIWKEYRNYIESYQVVGDYTDRDSNRVYITVVKIKEKYKDGKIIDPTRARTKQRNFIAKLMKEYSHDGALIAFYNESNPTWRLSFVKLDYSFTIDGVKEKLTPAKRLSYILGEDEASHTAEKQLGLLLGKKEEVTLEEIEEIFQIEKVTNEFFVKYKDKYLELKEYLEKDSEFIKESEKYTKKIEDFSEEFAKKLMGQLAFLYFLQKKGWLGVKLIPETLTLNEYNKISNNKSNVEKELLAKIFTRVSENQYKRSVSKIKELSDKNANILAGCFKNTDFDKDWGTGEKRFIRTLFKRHRDIEDKKNKGRNFFNDYLEPLFYDALNNHRGESQYFKEFNCKIPFLNGGLFEPLNSYDWGNTDFNIPDEIFSNRTDDDNGDGILDVFDRFNFTIAENEPFETEVAVDPEMLGKVFENLLDVKNRKSKGAFYTPREIVHYMCKESLINYLDNEVETAERKDIEQLIQMGEFTKEYDQHLFEMDYKKGKKINTEDWGLPTSILRNIDKIDKAIANVKIADPAIGSGAFPLGMLIEIVKVRSILTEYMIMHKYFILKKSNELTKQWAMEDDVRKERSLYNLKIETIENSLFGVDIEPSAVEIAKLRLWLSIVVDSENDSINPLPNLDFNFMVGNSLLDEFEGIKLFDEKLLDKDYSKKNLKNIQMGSQIDLFKTDESVKNDLIEQISRLHKEFFKEKNNSLKKEVKNKIEKLEWTLIQFTLQSSGNEDKVKELEKLQKEKRKPYFLWKLEFAEVFKEKGGFDIVIGNPPYVRYEKFKEIRSTLEKKYICYDTSADLYIYFYELGTNILKINGNINFITSNKWMKTKYGIKFRKFLLEKNKIYLLIDLGSGVFETASVDSNILSYNKIPNEDYNFYMGNTIKSKYLFSIKNMDEKCFVIMSKEEYLIKSKLENKTKRIKDLNFKIRRGILTGCNEVFLLGKDEIEIFQNEDFKKLLKPVLRGKDLKKYSIEYADIFLLATKNGLDIKNDYPKVYNYLENKNNELDGKLEKRYDRGSHWSNLRNCAYYSEFLKEKIIYPEFSSESSFVWEEGKYFNLDTTWYIFDETLRKYHLAILNSSLIWFYLKLISIQLGSSALRMKKIYIEQIPLKEVEENLKNILTEKVNKIISLKKIGKNTKDLELEIDEIVYDLYELTEEEKEIVRNFKN